VLDLEETATSTEIKKAYRQMSLKYHPDKSDADDAQAVFMRIATAYEVLSDDKMRKAYDDFLAHPERHVWEHYGHFYGAVYAPKSDLRLVIGGILVALSALQYSIFTTRRARLIEVILAQNKSQMYIKKRVVEMGGDAKRSMRWGATEAQYAAYKQLEQAATQEVLSKAIVDGKRLSDSMGILDVLLMRILLLPLDFAKGAYFHLRWLLLFTLLRKPFGAEEQVYLTCRVIKCIQVEWRSKDAEEQAELLGRELWLPENRLAWEEERREEAEEQRREVVQVSLPPLPFLHASAPPPSQPLSSRRTAHSSSSLLACFAARAHPFLISSVTSFAILRGPPGVVGTFVWDVCSDDSYTSVCGRACACACTCACVCVQSAQYKRYKRFMKKQS